MGRYHRVLDILCASLGIRGPVPELTRLYGSSQARQLIGRSFRVQQQGALSSRALWMTRQVVVAENCRSFSPPWFKSGTTSSVTRDTSQ